MDNKTITTIRVNKFALMGCSQSPRDVTTANLRLVKNVVEFQKLDQELRVSYKPTRFSGWVVDDGKIVYKLFTDRNFEGIYIPSKSGEMIEISRGLHLPKTREGVIRFLRKRATTELERQSKKECP